MAPSAQASWNSREFQRFNTPEILPLIFPKHQSPANFTRLLKNTRIPDRENLPWAGGENQQFAGSASQNVSKLDEKKGNADRGRTGCYTRGENAGVDVPSHSRTPKPQTRALRAPFLFFRGFVWKAFPDA